MHFLDRKFVHVYFSYSGIFPRGRFEKKPPPFRVMSWCRRGDKPLPEAIMTKFSDVYMRNHAAKAQRNNWMPHDDVIKWKHFPRDWPFVRVIHRSPSKRPVTRSFDVFFYLRLNKQLSELSRRRWFETPSHPLWRHCNTKRQGFNCEHSPDLRWEKNTGCFCSCMNQ